MTFQSRLSPEQWAEARRLRAEGASCAAIAGRFGVNPSTIALRARRERWPSLVPGLPAAVRASAAAAAERRRLVQRLYSVMNLRLELMELRMQQQLKAAKKHTKSKDKTDGSEMPAAGEEDTRHLGVLLKTIEQATELDPDRDRNAEGGAKPASSETSASEADAFRREIAERLEKLVPPA